MHTNQLPTFSRRQLLQVLGGGLGYLGLEAALNGHCVAAEQSTHFAPRAKRVIHLFMNGGPFSPDLFDPKPAMNQFAGQRPAEVELRTENATGGLMPVPFAYQKHGQCGLEVSELLPHFAKV